jgi:hypothetical protein
MEFRKSKEDKLNESAETFYQDFEWLAKKWKASPLKVTRPWFTWR